MLMQSQIFQSFSSPVSRCIHVCLHLQAESYNNNSFLITKELVESSHVAALSTLETPGCACLYCVQNAPRPSLARRRACLGIREDEETARVSTELPRESWFSQQSFCLFELYDKKHIFGFVSFYWFQRYYYFLQTRKFLVTSSTHHYFTTDLYIHTLLEIHIGTRYPLCTSAHTWTYIDTVPNKSYIIHMYYVPNACQCK